MKIKLSIIIPVYGVEDFIEECFHSLLPQINECIEVIVINDGSLDQSIDKLNILIDKFYSVKKNHVKIFNQDNSGQSVARNVGIAKSSGDYIAFIDPDDIVTENYISTILKVINGNDELDILHFNACQFDDASNSFIQSINFTNENIDLIKTDSFLQSLFLKNIWYPWIRVIRAEIMKDYLFIPGIYLEDMNLFPEIYYDERVQSVTEITEKIIIYRVREGSSIRDPFNQKIINGIDCGLIKFSKNDKNFYSILYNTLLLQRVSLFFIQGESFRYIYIYSKKHLKNVRLNYGISKKIWFFKRFNLIYLTLLKIKNLF